MNSAEADAVHTLLAWFTEPWSKATQNRMVEAAVQLGSELRRFRPDVPSYAAIEEGMCRWIPGDMHDPDPEDCDACGFIATGPCPYHEGAAAGADQMAAAVRELVGDPDLMSHLADRVAERKERKVANAA